MNDKIHWYDGWIYHKFIAPNQDITFRIMQTMMKKDTTVVDVGCGTGRFVFQAAEKFKFVVGAPAHIVLFQDDILKNPLKVNYGNAFGYPVLGHCVKGRAPDFEIVGGHKVFCNTVSEGA